MKFCLFAPFSGGVRDICGRQVPIIHSTGLLAPPAGVYVGNRFIFMFMLTPSVFVSNRFIVYVDVYNLPTATDVLWEVGRGNVIIKKDETTCFQHFVQVHLLKSIQYKPTHLESKNIVGDSPLLND